MEHYSVVQLTQKTAKKKRKLSSDLRSSWKIREAVGNADEDSDETATSLNCQTCGSRHLRPVAVSGVRISFGRS